MNPAIEIVRGDITQQHVDAVVNAANNSLLGGGGVDGAIHRAAGPELLKECKKLNGCATGEAKATKGYRLSAKYVIHTVGPVWHGGDRNEDQLLASAYRNSLLVALDLGVNTLAFPSISTGVYRFPIDRAATIALETVEQHLTAYQLPSKIVFVCFDLKVFETYKKLAATL